MSKRPCFCEAITKYELIRIIAKKSGYPIYQCSEIWEAFVEAMAETLDGGRAIVFKKLGRLEPYTKRERKMYVLSNETDCGIKLDENGEKVSYTFPPVRWIKFHIANNMKFRMNPGVYTNYTAVTEDDD